MSKNPHVNEEITAKSVRLIGSDGSQIGVVSIKEALSYAEDKGLDLVEIAPMAKPPVCKAIDYGKFRYEQTKKEKEARKKQHTVHVKKIRLTPNIDIHDFMVKADRARKFLDEGNRVKVTLFMRGRQITRKDLAEEVVTRMITELADISKPEGRIKQEGFNNLSIILVNKK